jgi:anti-sigma B factor antagonist
MTSMRVEVTHQGDVAVARAEGEIDLSNAGQLTDDIPPNVSDSCTAVVVDLSAVSYIDSAGIGALFALARWVGLRGQAMAIVLPEASPIARMLKITHVDEVADIMATVEGALEVFGDTS